MSDYSADWLPFASAMVQAGCSSLHIDETKMVYRKVVRLGGAKSWALLLKKWKQLVINIISGKSNSSDDRSTNGYCRHARRYVFKFQQFGYSDSVIKDILDTQGRRGIPPFLITPELALSLTANPSFDVLARVVPFVHITRTAALGDSAEVVRSLIEFEAVVSDQSTHGFSLYSCVRRLLLFTKFRPAKTSKWKVTGRSSYASPRSEGGKIEDFHQSYICNFCFIPLTEMVPEKPTENLYDITGTVFLRPEDWDPNLMVWEAAYREVGPSVDRIDNRLGHLGVFWSLYDLRAHCEYTADEDYPCLGAGRIPTFKINLSRFHARVCPVPEPGWKVRIITVLELSLAILGSVGRHFLDPPLRGMDPSIQIGLRSGVKLYDWLQYLNGSHSGIADTTPNQIVYRFNQSVDLTNATNTPRLETSSSVLSAIGDHCSNEPSGPLIALCCDLASTVRLFDFPDGHTLIDHINGLMMGEGLSGIYLNTTSAIVRYLIIPFSVAFNFYEGKTVDDADDFIRANSDKIQDFLDSADFDFGAPSSQSGDDMINFSYEELSDHMILLYRVMGYVPSQTTWSESSRFGTFCEEVILRTNDSNGWTFVDIVKPRLFTVNDGSGAEGVVSRIGQICRLLKYKGDTEVTQRLIPLIDQMIEFTPNLCRVVNTLNIPVGFPAWLGGLEHPCGLEELYILSVDQRYRDLLLFFREASWDQLCEIFLIVSYDTHDSSMRDSFLTCISAMAHAMQDYTIGGANQGLAWISSEDLEPILPVRQTGEKYSQFVDRRKIFMSESGFIDILEFSEMFTSAWTSRESLLNGVSRDFPITLKLRKKQEYLFSVLPDEYIGSSTDMDEEIFNSYRRIQTELRSRFFNLEDIKCELGIDWFPNYSISCSTITGRG